MASAEASNTDPQAYIDIREWEDKGRCNDNSASMNEIFFATKPEVIDAAKIICQSCVVQVLCLDYAIATRQAAGVWGGEHFSQGKITDTPQKIGRPTVTASKDI